MQLLCVCFHAYVCALVCARLHSAYNCRRGERCAFIVCDRECGVVCMETRASHQRCWRGGATVHVVCMEARVALKCAKQCQRG